METEYVHKLNDESKRPAGGDARERTISIKVAFLSKNKKCNFRTRGITTYKTIKNLQPFLNNLNSFFAQTKKSNN